uniref:Sema domain-containing protein n=1 Tax=Tetranychus urticae TaxID=32264 RepID=A0A158P4U8_TETUR
MFIQLLIWIFQFCLLIPKAYSFSTPKHDIAFYYKTHASVSLTNPDNHTTSYGIYVAGKTITIDIPTSVVNLSEILDWKVVNPNKDRLMFVHKNNPYILINQQRIEKMNYSGELSDSIIAFGDNEALHVPTISNPNSIKPVHTWNYIELLHFDDSNEKVSVLRSLPMLKDDDWKFIKEWKMMDYIHFDDKLYLLIKRSIWNQKAAKVTQEISIIQLCLDKGSELISSAVEVHFTRPEFNTNQIIDLFFVYIFGPLNTENHRLEFHTTQLTSPNIIKTYQTYAITDIVSLFDQTANESAICSDGITSLRYHLRSEVAKCNETIYESCSTTENNVPSRNVELILPGSYTFFLLFYSLANVLHKSQFITLPYPYLRINILMHTRPLINSAICEYINNSVLHPCLNFNTIDSSLISNSLQGNFYINKHPFGFIYVDKETNNFNLIPIEMCSHLKTCAHCIMYGLYSDCIWSNFICVHDTQPKSKAKQTVDRCNKIINISPLIFNSSLPRRLTIKLARPLINASEEQIVIQAGDNLCTDITMKKSIVNCSMLLTTSGEFKINISLRSDRYADAAAISAVSTDKVNILAPERRHDYTFVVILVSFSVTLISLSLLLACVNYNNKYRNEFLVVKSSTNIMQMASKNIRSALSSLSRSRSYSTWRSTSKIIVPKHSK